MTRRARDKVTVAGNSVYITAIKDAEDALRRIEGDLKV